MTKLECAEQTALTLCEELGGECRSFITARKPDGYRVTVKRVADQETRVRIVT